MALASGDGKRHTNTGMLSAQRVRRFVRASIRHTTGSLAARFTAGSAPVRRLLPHLRQRLHRLLRQRRPAHALEIASLLVKTLEVEAMRGR